MTPEVYWIRDIEPLKLAIMARPRGGEWLEEEILGWKRLGIGTVASLLHPYEADELCIATEGAFCAANDIEFISFPIKDRGVPERVAPFFEFVDLLTARVRAGVAVAVHCRAGIGRSGLTAASVLQRLGTPAHAVFSSVSKARGLVVPDTRQQIEWLHETHTTHLARPTRDA